MTLPGDEAADTHDRHVERGHEGNAKHRPRDHTAQNAHTDRVLRTRARTVRHRERQNAETESERCHQNRAQTQTNGFKRRVHDVLTLVHHVLGEFHDQNRVLGHQADRRQKSDLEVHVVVHAEVVGEAQSPDHTARNHENDRDRHGPAFIERGQAKEHDQNRDRIERGLLRTRLTFLIRHAVPGNAVTRR